MARSSSLLIALAAAALSGCAAGPRIDVTPPAAFQPGAATYRLAVPDAGAPDVTAATAAVRRQLQARGWREGDKSADWLIEIAYGVRPQRTGAFTDDAARQGEWTASPVLPQWWAANRKTHVLSLTLNGPGAAPTVYEASTRTVVGDRKQDAALEALAAAVVAELPEAQ
ncbi:MAG: DUF4136 domain-containing protein [Candidatus Brevundimonas phytovorans]|nr:DUF4136 domain-containing protein [Brevundimonas sp.]WEK58480.1 MAG: DUF4136 domain-containing protein [Brevundimonas sp.]